MANENSDWIAHDGGPCPVADDVIVQVRLRGFPWDKRRASTTSGKAYFWKVGTDWWRHLSPRRENDILEYRVVPA